jgi:Ankyrin repeat
LLSAVENCQVEMVALLLTRGANPNQAGYGGWTPLQNAIDIGLEQAKHNFDASGRFVPVDTTVVALLLAAGARSAPTRRPRRNGVRRGKGNRERADRATPPRARGPRRRKRQMTSNG